MLLLLLLDVIIFYGPIDIACNVEWQSAYCTRAHYTTYRQIDSYMPYHSILYFCVSMCRSGGGGCLDIRLVRARRERTVCIAYIYKHLCTYTHSGTQIQKLQRIIALVR